MSYRLPRVLLVTIALICTFTVAHRTAFAADPAIVSVSPATASATVGDNVELDVTAASVPAQPGIGGYLLVLTWNPAVLSLTSFADAGWVIGGQIIVVCTPTSIDNVAGGAAAACTPVIGFGAGVSTSEPRALAHATFHAKAPGTTSISLTGSDPPSSLINPSNGDIAATFTGGSVIIGASAQVAATTETPGPSVTPTLPIGVTSTPVPSSTPTTAPTGAPSSETTAATSAPPIPQTPSTKPTQGTLSKVEVPRTGSGGADHGGIAWWIPVLTTAGAALLVTSGVTAFRWSRRRRS